MKYRNWSTEQWHQVVFSDKVKPNIWGPDEVKYYWTTPNGVLLWPLDIDVTTVKHGRGKLSIRDV